MTNMVAGLLNVKVISPMEYGGTTDHIVFETWFIKMLLPALPSGNTIIMDNATFHRNKILTELAIKAKCNVLFLPPYSTDYNPIENVWANLKNKIRYEGKNFDDLQDVINDFF